MMKAARPIRCTIQIPISDRDEAYAQHVLPHQLRKLGQYADDVLISVNRPSAGQGGERLDELLGQSMAEFSNVRVKEVSYAAEAVDWVSSTFFGGCEYPLYDFKGIPIHAFLEQYRFVESTYLFHLAPDLLLGGDGTRWLGEAIAYLEAHSDVLTVSPLGGPPSELPYHSEGTSVSTSAGRAYRVSKFSGRNHLVNLGSFVAAMRDLPQNEPVRLKERLQAKLVGNSSVDHLERLFEARMLERGEVRVDFGGSGDFWTLHPLFKTQQFVDRVPSLVDRVEAGDVPVEQAGHYDVHPSLLPQTDIPTRFDIAKRTAEAFLRRRISA